MSRDLVERAARADLSNILDALERRLNKDQLTSAERANCANSRSALTRACCEAFLWDARPSDVLKLPIAAIARKHARPELGEEGTG